METIFSLKKLCKNCKFAQKLTSEANRGILTNPSIQKAINYYASKCEKNPIDTLKEIGLEYELKENEFESLNNAYEEWKKQEKIEDLTCTYIGKITSNKFCANCPLKDCLNSHSDFYDIENLDSNITINSKIPILNVEILPVDSIKRLLVDTQNSMNVPIEYLLVSLITIIATAIGLNYSVKFDNTWSIYSNLLSVIIGEPSSKKSPSMKLFVNVLNEIEEETNTLITISNTTVEGVCKYMSDSKKQVLIACDELKGWLNSLGEYKGKNSSDRQFYLSAWNCERYVVIRKTSSNIIILGSIQPEILEDMFKYINTGDGFIERILWVIPTDYQEIGKYIGRGNGNLDKKTISVFKGILKEILTFNGHKEYSLSKNGDSILSSYEQELKQKAKNNHKYSALYGKSLGLTGKLALIFQVYKDTEARNYDNKVIENDILKGSIELTKYFIQQFIAINSLFCNETSKAVQDNIEDTVYNWLANRYEDIKTGFKPSYISTYKVAKIYKAEEAKNVLDTLKDKGRLAYNPISKDYILMLE